MKRPGYRRWQVLAVGVLLCLVAGGATRAQDLQATVQTGWQALQQGKLADARAAFQSVLDAAPNYDFGWYAIGQVALREGKYDEAIDSFKQATELKPEKFEYQYGLAAVYRTQRQYAKAVATLNNAEQYAADKQNKYYLHLERGLSYLSLKQYARSADDLKEAVAIQPGEFTAEQRLGMALTGTEDYAAAAEHLAKAAEKKPDDYDTQLYLARALLNAALITRDREVKAANYKQAAVAAQAANAARPGFDALNLLGRAQLGKGDAAHAVTTFKQVLKAKPDYCPARANMGQAYVNLKQFEPAAQILEEARKCDPQSTLVLNLLGLSYSNLGRRDEALATYEKSYELKASPVIAEKIDLVKKNIEIAVENAATEAYNAEQMAELERERAEHEKEQAEFEKQQKALEQYKKKTDDN
ncbi:MAG: tetratricopeptide repeat protein [Acidobacteriota bacterium]